MCGYRFHHLTHQHLTHQQGLRSLKRVHYNDGCVYVHDDGGGVR